MSESPLTAASARSTPRRRGIVAPEKLPVVWESVPDEPGADALFQAFALILRDDRGYPQDRFDNRDTSVH